MIYIYPLPPSPLLRPSSPLQMPFHNKIKQGFSRFKDRVRGLASEQSSSSISDHAQSNAPEPVTLDPMSPSSGLNDPPAPSTGPSAKRTASIRGHAPGQPSTSSTNNHSRSNPLEPVVVDPVVPPVSSDPPVPSAERGAKKTAWAALKMSLGLLQKSAEEFGPLKSAVEGISRCMEIFEVCAPTRNAYYMGA